MAAAGRKIGRRTEANADFLLSRPGARAKPPAAAPDDLRPEAILAADFPELAREEPFAERFRRQTADLERFAVLAARPDAPAPGEADPERLAASWRAVARGVGETARAAGGFWGLAAEGICAAVLPEREVAQALEAAHRLQAELLTAGHLTTTVGVAGYPCDGFGREEVAENARKALAHAAFFGPNSRVAFDAVSLNISADALFDRGEIAAAIREFERALGLDPRCANLHNSLGVCYGVQGAYERALAAFAEASRLDPADHMSVYNTGLVHWLAGDRERALAHFRRAHALRPQVGDILFQLGRLLLELDRPAEARPFLESAGRAKSRRRGVFRHLGDCYARLGLAAKAIAAYQKAVRGNAADAHALSALGELFLERGENPEIALVFCRESVAHAPGEALYRRRLGRALERAGRTAEALAELEEAARLGAAVDDEIRRLRAGLEEGLTP